jgi:hypothetical protein
MAEVTGGDLHRLWRVSEVLLPRVADVFYDASRTLGGAAGNSAAFPADDAAYPGSTFMVSSVGTAWENLRSTMQSIMNHAGDVVMEAAQGVRVATAIFDQVDEENGKSLLDAYHETQAQDYPKPDPNSRPPVPGSPDYPVRPQPAPGP